MTIDQEPVLRESTDGTECRENLPDYFGVDAADLASRNGFADFILNGTIFDASATSRTNMREALSQLVESPDLELPDVHDRYTTVQRLYREAELGVTTDLTGESIEPGSVAVQAERYSESDALLAYVLRLALGDLPIWRQHGECNGLGGDGALFFPGRGQKDKVAKAKTICADCGVREDCLEYALDNKVKSGVWGGLTEAERNRILQQRKRAAASKK